MSWCFPPAFDTGGWCGGGAVSPCFAGHCVGRVCSFFVALYLLYCTCSDDGNGFYCLVLSYPSTWHNRALPNTLLLRRRNVAVSEHQLSSFLFSMNATTPCLLSCLSRCECHGRRGEMRHFPSSFLLVSRVTRFVTKKECSRHLAIDEIECIEASIAVICLRDARTSTALGMS